MRDDLTALEAWCQPLLEKLTGSQRARLTRTLAARLRTSQAGRIARQQNPDGSAYAPRKPRARDKKGGIRRGMFARLRANAHLRTASTPNVAAVQFLRRTARIASIHQEGGWDRVSRTGGKVHYEQRQLLGFTDADQRIVRELLVDHLRR